MSDPGSSSSVARLAEALHRRYGVWMASPSVALLAALIAGKGRPKRILVEEKAPSFLSNIGRMAGAMPVVVPVGRMDQTLRAILQTEGVSPDLVWAVATHRAGSLAPLDWLSDSRVHHVPSVELCLGSVQALARLNASSATLTVVSLDAETGLSGVGLTALLTDDRALLERVSELCLPAAGSSDYVLDAAPRRLNDDDAPLLALVERALGLSALNTAAAPLAASFDLGWSRRFQEDPADQGRARLREAEQLAARSAQALATMRTQVESLQAEKDGADDHLVQLHRDLSQRAESLSALQSDSDRKIADLRSEKDELERSLAAARTDTAASVNTLSTLRLEADNQAADLRGEKDQLERSLAAACAEREALSLRLAEANRDRDDANKTSANRQTEWQRGIDDLTRRAERAESDALELGGRAASLAVALGESSSRAAQLDQDLLSARKEFERELTLIRTERDAHSTRVETSEAGRAQALDAAARHEASLRANLEEEKARAKEFHEEIRTLKERETRLSKSWDATRLELTARIARLESDSVVKDNERTDLVAEKAALLSSVDALRQRGQQFEKDAAALKEREALLSTGLDATRAELKAQIARLELDATSRSTELADLLARKAVVERELTIVGSERETLQSKLETLDKQFAAANVEAARRESALRTALDEEKQRSERSEKKNRSEIADRDAGVARELTAATNANADLTGRLQQAESTRKALENRVHDLERSVMIGHAEKAAVEQRLSQLEASHRREIEAGASHLSEARRAAQAAATQAAETWRSRLDAAEVTAQALRTALDARAAEAAAYEKAHAVGNAHRLALEERIAQLKTASPTQDAPRDPGPSAKEPAVEFGDLDVDIPASPLLPPVLANPATQREPAPWEVQRPRFAPALSQPDAAVLAPDTSSRDLIDATLELPQFGQSTMDQADEEKHRSEREAFLDIHRSDFTPEYEHRNKPDPDSDKTARGWLRGVASRIRRG